MLKQSLILVTATVLALSLGSTSAVADDVVTVIVKKQEEKRKNRWSLAEWLDTRDRMRMMDMWLALHSPSPYEYFLGANYQLGQNMGSRNFPAWSVQGAAYSSIFGLEGQFISTPDNLQVLGIFNLRVFGYHAQATNITLQVGIKHQQDTILQDSMRNAFAGLSMTLYLAKFFGVQGLYRLYFQGTPHRTGQSGSGSRIEGTVFLDHSIVRVYGTYFVESASLNLRDTRAAGVIVGTQLFF